MHLGEGPDAAQESKTMRSYGRWIRDITAKVVLAASVLLGGIGNSSDAQQENSDNGAKTVSVVPEELAKNIIYESVKEKRDRCMYVIPHWHGNLGITPPEEYPKWMAHQDDVLDMVITLVRRHGPEKTRVFFENNKGPVATWSNRELATKSWQSFSAWKGAKDDGKKTIEATFENDMRNAKDIKDAWKIWHGYTPAIGFAGYSAEKGWSNIVFGSEPLKKIPLRPDPDEFPSESLEIFNMRMQKMVWYNVFERNRHVAQLMNQAVPRGGTGVLVMGAAHSKAAHDRYPSLRRIQLTEENALETYLNKIPDSKTIVIAPSTAKSMEVLR